MDLLDSVLQGIVDHAGNITRLEFRFCIKNQLIKRLVISFHMKGFLILVIQMADCLLCVHYKSCDIFCCMFSKSARVIFSGVILIQEV